jgi:2'-5' RNA ligase
VAKERLKSPRVRLFVALDLPDDVREGLAAWQGEAVAAEDALRPVARDALHVTLCFLGYPAEKNVEPVTEIVGGLEPPPIGIRFEADPVAVPRRRPRLFAIDAPSEGTVALQSELSDRLETGRFYEPEKRPFWSHVTVARVKRSTRVDSPPGPLPDGLLEPFSAVRVRLYRSTLRPSGAEYAPLADLTLPPVEAEKR